METQYGIVAVEPQESQRRSSMREEGPAWLEGASVQERSEWFGAAFGRFLSPLLHHLHQKIDLRPVRNLIQAVEAILSFRDRANGLLLSELGDAMDGVGGGGGLQDSVDECKK